MKEGSLSREALAKAGPTADCVSSIVWFWREFPPRALLVLSLDLALACWVNASQKAGLALAEKRLT